MTPGDMPQDFDRLLGEADELIKRIDSQGSQNIKEVHRTSFETHAQILKKRRSEIEEQVSKEKGTDSDSPSEGMHEAIHDIVKAMKALGGYLS